MNPQQNNFEYEWEKISKYNYLWQDFVENRI